MKFVARVFQQAHAGLHRLRRLLTPSQNWPEYQMPTLQLAEPLSGLISPRQSPMAVTRVNVISMSCDFLVVKTKTMMDEGSPWSLELELPGQGPVQLFTEVEWFGLSTYQHSVGLKVRHHQDSRARLQQFYRGLGQLRIE